MNSSIVYTSYKMYYIYIKLYSNLTRYFFILYLYIFEFIIKKISYIKKKIIIWKIFVLLKIMKKNQILIKFKNLSVLDKNKISIA